MVVPPEVTTAVELRSVLLKPGPRQICLDRMHVWVLSICRRSTRRVELTGSFSLSAVRKQRLVLHIPMIQNGVGIEDFGLDWLSLLCVAGSTAA